MLSIHDLKMIVYELLKLLWQKWAGAFSCKATTLHYMQAAVETQKTGFSFKQNLVRTFQAMSFFFLEQNLIFPFITMGLWEVLC